ncbi:MAG: hypothetical protein H7833_19440 [Magnetococcus sp. DMHC-1]|nr:hypothetical protein [Magnetococcales bacterium]
MAENEEEYCPQTRDGIQTYEALAAADFAARILAAVAEGGRRAALEHKRAGIPMAECRDGRVILIPPEEIRVPEAPAFFHP